MNLNYSNNYVYKKVNGLVNSITKSNPTDRKHAKLIARVATVLVIASMPITYISFLKSNTGSQSMYNWSMFSTALALFTVVLLSIYVGESYWVQLLRKTKLDERQQNVKWRVIQKSYSALILLVASALIFMPGVISSFDLSAAKTLQLPLLEIMIYMFALPSVFAAWEKDS